MDNITLSFDENDLSILNEALVNLPFKVSAPLINKINKQLQERSNDGTASNK